MLDPISAPATALPPVPRDVASAMMRGARHTCPACGQGHLYTSYLKVVDHCGHCGEALHHQRADDAPPYVTIFIVGHVVVGGILALEQAYAPDSWVHAAIWGPLTIASSLLLLPRIKGAFVGLQWALRMHGFSGEGADAAVADPAAALHNR